MKKLYSNRTEVTTPDGDGIIIAEEIFKYARRYYVSFQNGEAKYYYEDELTIKSQK
jgi:hypothetical protein